jgi:hypothetical protein
MFFSDVWNSIPAGSMLNVQLSANAGFGLSGSHTLATANGPVLKGPITSADFPLEIPIGANERHKVKLDILFAGAPATVTVTAEVVLPDGTSFDGPTVFPGKVSALDKVLTVKLFANG